MKLYLFLISVFFSITFCLAQDTVSPDIKTQIRLFWNNYKADTVIQPYCRKYSYRNKQVVFFGTRHDKNAEKMFVEIEKEIITLKPTVILTEGNALLLDTKKETVNAFADLGFCSFTGFENNIAVRSWDLPYNERYYLLRSEYKEEELFVLMVITDMLSILNSFEEGFSHALLTYDMLGWPFKPRQKSKSFFLKQYRKYFDATYNGVTGEDLLTSLKKIGKATLITKFQGSYQQLRDQHLLKKLGENLRIHDKIFIQAGSAHLSSLEKIIPLIMEKAVTENLQNVSDPIQHISRVDYSDSINRTRVIKTDKQTAQFVLLGSDHNITNAKDPQFGLIKREISGFRPDLILTQGFDPLYPSQKQTIQKSGDVGLCRYIGVTNSIRVNSWEPSWNEVYDKLAGKYAADDIYFSLMGWSMLRNINRVSYYSSTDEFIEIIFDLFYTSGYTFKIGANGFDFLKSLSEYLHISLADTYCCPSANTDNPPGGILTMNADGSYSFSGKRGTYLYNVSRRSFEQNTAFSTIPLAITVDDPMPDRELTITGALQPPSINLSIEQIKALVAKSINQDIINDMHLIRANHLLKVTMENRAQYHKILIQADVLYINALGETLKRTDW